MGDERARELRSLDQASIIDCFMIVGTCRRHSDTTAESCKAQAEPSAREKSVVDGVMTQSAVSRDVAEAGVPHSHDSRYCGEPRVDCIGSSSLTRNGPETT